MRRLQGSRHDFHMCAATAQVELEFVADLLFGWMRLTIEQSLQRHDHAVDAIAALRGLLVDESLLYGRWVIGSTQPFKSGNFMTPHAFNWYDTGTRSHT